MTIFGCAFVCLFYYYLNFVSSPLSSKGSHHDLDGQLDTHGAT